ncbi:exodeoxyribonuclease VII small subunit [Thermococcus aggregans]|uniref:Exodeoxyribonuclease VII small subunit n=1 Tax=Thermococcus aggregans TaxID=110163 RepID=A0A9E7MW61_THEAG|nr:exodeoxyribonuclease VII small subunit [Thermococcus aggregans]USS40036.1 exodeoxyribonuclease VII small subunit [Thermococcus aggregans]
MKKLGSFLLILLLSLSFAQAETVDHYKEEFTLKVKLLQNGDAQITVTTSILGPKDEIQKEIASVLNQTNMSEEEAIAKFEKEQLDNYVASLANAGINTKNQTFKLTSIKEDNFTAVFAAYAEKFAKYYSYDDYWEIVVDPTRGYGTMPTPTIGLPQRIELHNIFIIELPENAELVEYPKEYTREFGQSKFHVLSKVEGNKIIISSDIYLEENLSPEGFEALFGDYNAFYIRYTTPHKGEETYQPVKTEQYIRAEISEDGTTNLRIRETYIEPKEQIELMKLQINLMGAGNVTNMILQNSLQGMVAQGITVEDANASILGLDKEGPLTIETNYVLKNFTKLVDGIYEYSFDPTLLNPSQLGYRAQNEINQSLRIEFIIPQDAEIVEVPNNVSKEVKGNRYILSTNVEGSKILITANVFVRYGAPFEDIQSLLGEVTRAYIRYRLPSEESKINLTTPQIAGIAGAAVLIGIALFMLKKR